MFTSTPITHSRTSRTELELPAPISQAPQKEQKAEPLSQKELADLTARSSSANAEERKKAVQEIEKLPLESGVRLFEHFRDQKLLGKPSSDDAMNALGRNLKTPRIEIGEMMLNFKDEKLKNEDIRILNAVARCGFGIATEPQKNSSELYADSRTAKVAQVEDFRDAIAESIKLAAPGGKSANEYIDGAHTDMTTLILKDGREVLLGVERGGFFPGLQIFDVRIRSKTTDARVTVIGTFKDE